MQRCLIECSSLYIFRFVCTALENNFVQSGKRETNIVNSNHNLSRCLYPRNPHHLWWLNDVIQDDRRDLAKSSNHNNNVIMGAVPSQITSLTIVYSAVYWGTDQRKHQSSASLAFVRGIHQWPVNSPHIWPVTRKMFPFDDVIMLFSSY